jgi:predicted Fe-Mo cluster-binding NifX family protein
MKIAVVSEDGETVSRHFGRANRYVIIKTDGTKIIGKEYRSKTSHDDLAKQDSAHQCRGCGTRGQESSSYDKHRWMALNILDCSVLLAGGMGREAYEGVHSRGIEVVITEVENIEQAVRFYLYGKGVNFNETPD